MLGLKKPRFRTGKGENNDPFLYLGAAAGAVVYAWLHSREVPTEEALTRTGGAAVAGAASGLFFNAISEWPTAITRAAATGLVGVAALGHDIMFVRQGSEPILPNTMERLLPIAAEIAVGSTVVAGAVTPRDLSQEGAHH